MVQQGRRIRGTPDPHALRIAAAAQVRVRPDIVILFGSRAVGDHRQESDVDILVVTDGTDRLSSESTAREAAQSYMQENPPLLELGIVSMDRRTFDRCRQANQHIAGQAVIYGVNMSGERLDYRYNHEDDYPNHWPETRQRVSNAEEWKQEMDTMVDNDHWNKRLLGMSAQQSVENALKGWLSTHQDEGRYGHNLNGAWRKINELEDWSDPDMEDLRRSVQELIDFTTYPDPSREDPSRTSNWLTQYAAVYRYGRSNHTMNREEQEELRTLVDRAVEGIVELIHDRSGTDDEDVYPDGKPWEL